MEKNNPLDGNNLIDQIVRIAILFTDQELKKHFSPDAPKVFRVAADRIEEVYKRKDEI